MLPGMTPLAVGGQRKNNGNDAFTKLLLHCEGTDGSTSFVDSSASPYTITAAGNAQIDTSDFKFGLGSALFDGSGDKITTASATADFSFGTGDFTFDFWIKSTQTSRVDPIGWNYDFHSAGWGGLIFNLSGSGSMAWYEGGTSRIAATGTGWNNGAWRHVAVTRSGNSMRMFLDGTQIGSTYTTSFTYGAANSGIICGEQQQNNGPLNGRMDEIRVSKGIARWTANFTPPTRAYS